MTAVFGKHQGGKQYFFDLLAILQQEFPHDLFRFKNDKLNKKYESADKICVCFEPRRLAASEDNPRFVRGRDLIAGDGMGKIVSFLNTLDIESHSAEFSAYMNKLAQLHNIGDYIVYTNIINENTPEGEAVDIFLRINRGGVPLKLGDLINAQSFQYPQITDGLKNVLAKGVRQHLKRNPAIRPALRLLEYRNENDFNIIPLLTVMHLYHSYINGKETFRLRDSLPLYSFGSLKFFEIWKSPVGTRLFEGLDFLAEHQWHKIWGAPQVQRFLAFVMAEPEILNDRTLINRLKYALLNHAFQTEDNVSIANRRLMEFCRHLAEILKSDKPAIRKYENLPQVSNPFKISKEMVLNTNKGLSKMYQMIVHLMNEEKRGLFAQDLSGLSLNPSGDDADQHHIFPRSLHKHIRFSNSIANITLLDKSVNQKQIADIPFERYMETLEQRLGTVKFDEVCRLNLIDYRAYQQDRKAGMDEDTAVLRAIERRAGKIADFVNNYFMHG